MTTSTISASSQETQSGDRTHHHDQVMIPVSFRTIKAMVNSPVKPIPPLVSTFRFFIRIHAA